MPGEFDWAQSITTAKEENLSLFTRIAVMGFVLVSAAAAPSLAAIRARVSGDDGYKIPVGPDEIKVVSYNVENLFDNKDDPGKLDATFLPIGAPSKKTECPTLKPQYRAQCFNTDWTPAKLEIKLRNLKMALEAQGPMPDLLALAEIENAAVARMFADVLGYKEILVSDGPDSRGIDVALFWRPEKLALAAHKSILVPKMTTRPVLKALFRVRAAQSRKAGGDLVVFANHWPSQAAPTPNRAAVARLVRREIDNDVKTFGPDYKAIVMGDFNSIDTEIPHPIGDVLLDPKWKHTMKDAHSLSDMSDNPMNGVMPNGTHFFSGRWNRLDKILVSPALHDGAGMEIIPASFRVVAPELITVQKGKHRIPWRCDHNADDPRRAGFSDHLPIAVKFRLPN